MKRKVLILCCIILLISLINKILIHRREIQPLTPYTYDYIASQLSNPKFIGLDNSINMVMNEPVVASHENDQYKKIEYRFEFYNILDKPITFYFHLFSDPSYTNLFYEGPQDLQYNKPYVTINPGSRLGASFSIVVINPDTLNEESKQIFNDNYHRFIGYFRVDDKEFIQRVSY